MGKKLDAKQDSELADYRQVLNNFGGLSKAWIDELCINRKTEILDPTDPIKEINRILSEVVKQDFMRKF
jgi:hypothetical protein